MFSTVEDGWVNVPNEDIQKLDSTSKSTTVKSKCESPKVQYYLPDIQNIMPNDIHVKDRSDKSNQTLNESNEMQNKLNGKMIKNNFDDKLQTALNDELEVIEKCTQAYKQHLISHQNSVLNKVKLIKIEKFNPNEMMFSKWSEIYYSASKENGCTNEQIVDNMIKYMPDNLDKTIKIFPKDVKWDVYRKNIQELLVNQSDELLSKKSYKDYKSFLDFFNDKLRLLDDLYLIDKSIDAQTKKKMIYNLLDDKFKNDELLKIDEVELHEFGVICAKMEKSFRIRCSKCKAITHTTLECDLKSPNLIPNYTFFDLVLVLVFILVWIIILYAVLHPVISWFIDRQKLNQAVAPKPDCFGSFRVFFNQINNNIVDYLNRFLCN